MGEVGEMIGGTVPMPGGLLEPGARCAAAGAVAGTVLGAVTGAPAGSAAGPAGEEQLLRLLESAVSQLNGVVEELRLVGTDTRDMAESVRALTAVDWRSPAGEGFAQWNHRLWQRATDLAGIAEESVVLARASIQELHEQIARLRESLRTARTAVVVAATLGAC